MHKTVTLLVLVFLLGNCHHAAKLEQQEFSGPTMGTTYHVTVIDTSFDEMQVEFLRHGIDSILAGINQAMSTYLEDSEISRFNQQNSTYPVEISPAFREVVQYGLKLCTASQGAFDITVMPLVNFYGFGSEPGEDRFPTVEEIDAWLDLTGCDRIGLDSSSIWKTDPDVSIDLSAIAKGYAADAVMTWLGASGYLRAFVEVGGEVLARGMNGEDLPWRIGIDRPHMDALPGQEFQHILGLHDHAVATSGDYRNYREIEGQRVSHMMDPRTGYPIDHNLASVSVIAENCMVADGAATMLMVMGVQEGLIWMADHPELDALFISRLTDGSFQEHQTPGFSSYLLK